MPQIEFEHNMVVLAAMGSVPSTGFAITIDSVVVRGSSTEVHVLLGSPGSLCIQGMALTNPLDIVESQSPSASSCFMIARSSASARCPEVRSWRCRAKYFSSGAG